MSSEGGLTRRRPVASSTTNSESASAYSNDNGDPIENGREKNENEDSKETRLTLMEEVLLLGLKDKEVRISMRGIVQL